MTDHNLLARIQELIRERDDYERRFRSAQDSERTLAQMVHDYGAQRDEARATKDMFKERYNNADRDLTTYRSLYEARQLLYLSDITRARRAGQGQALKALLEELDGRRYDTEGAEADYIDGYHTCLESLKFWAQDQLRELGEEPREVR